MTEGYFREIYHVRQKIPRKPLHQLRWSTSPFRRGYFLKSFKSHNIYHCGDCGALWGYTPTRKTTQFPVKNGCCGAVGLIRTFSYIEKKIFFRFRISENKIVYIWGKTAPQPHTPITAYFFNTFRPHKQPHAIAKSPHIQSNSVSDTSRTSVSSPLS